ncbi:Hypothetical protein A7982_11238 [Minicystis rosea]|nr:Hypothetical protein A7982_11238 [Minicystis rosea]
MHFHVAPSSAATACVTRADAFSASCGGAPLHDSFELKRMLRARAGPLSKGFSFAVEQMCSWSKRGCQEHGSRRRATLIEAPGPASIEA